MNKHLFSANKMVIMLKFAIIHCELMFMHNTLNNADN